jgi:solute carrier family 12 sodium/potassium/chloride transporter 2
MMRDLHAIAPLLTMYFLITYSVINIVLLVESSSGLVSFRPTMGIHWIVPLLGAIGGVFTMFIVNPTFGLIASLVDVGDFTTGVIQSIQSLQSAFSRPNTLFLSTEYDLTLRDQFDLILTVTRKNGVGVLLLATHPRAKMGVNGVVNLWLREQPVWDMDLAFAQIHLNLSLLLAYRLSRSWKADINLVMVGNDETQIQEGNAFMVEPANLARLPKRTQCHVFQGNFPEDVGRAPLSDLAIVGMRASPEFALMEEVIQRTRAPCLFVADSGLESARA